MMRVWIYNSLAYFHFRLTPIIILVIALLNLVEAFEFNKQFTNHVYSVMMQINSSKRIAHSNSIQSNLLFALLTLKV